ncbi:unnamed protein product [Protopolystoma xenopodis]|uniref:Uncharacterized protein n=1 Tax=Protopolystoma xenopodis TaxID=117903 RepID=A0A3S5AXD0_9PLAT|nr:unnamed protein product [Protopolystoma xenopodis]
MPGVFFSPLIQRPLSPTCDVCEKRKPKRLYIEPVTFRERVWRQILTLPQSLLILFVVLRLEGILKCLKIVCRRLPKR